MTRRITLALAATAVAVAGQLAFAATASADDLCYVSVYDSTPGTYPGGMTVDTNCLDKVSI